jgi:dCMP deaminase
MRPTKDITFLAMAKTLALRTTCVRRGVGCIVVNARGHILSTGYNGTAAGLPHCNEGHCCQGYDLPPGQDNCEAIHAEMNAVLQCHDVQAIDTIYVTLSPCIRCTKMLLNTSCTRIVFGDNHIGQTGQELWERAGRIWLQYKDYNDVKRS